MPTVFRRAPTASPDASRQRPDPRRVTGHAPRRVAGRALVELAEHGLQAAVHVDAVVGVADRRVERRELVAALGDRPGEGAQPGVDPGGVDRLAHAPHRRPGVTTGASQSAVSSSSRRSRLIEQPAMSSAVM